MVLCEGRVDPVVPRQDVLVEPGVHALPGAPRRERPPAPHEGIQHGKGVEVGVEVGAALAG